MPGNKYLFKFLHMVPLVKQFISTLGGTVMTGLKLL